MSSGRWATSKRAAPVQIEPGPNGLAKERIADIQRARMLSAMVDVVVERGASNATVAHVVARSGVSRRTFYELFADREECFLAALDDAIARASNCVVPAHQAGGSWAERLRLALDALLSFLDVERGVGYLLIVESLGAGATALERRQRVLAQIITVVDAGRGEGKTASAPPPLTAEGIVGAVFSIVHARMVSGEDRPLVELANPLMSMIVLPYLGPAAARKELERPVPKRPPADRRAVADPLRDLGMRLTYRTVRVLMYVAAEPGSSNRQIGLGSGIADQGQISKLLGRLEQLGLVRNTGLGPGQGAPNVWTLTERGAAAHAAIAAPAKAARQQTP